MHLTHVFSCGSFSAVCSLPCVRFGRRTLVVYVSTCLAGRSLGAQVLLSTLRLSFFSLSSPGLRLRVIAQLRGRAVLLSLAKDGGCAPGSGSLLLCMKLQSGTLAIFSCLISSVPILRDVNRFALRVFELHWGFLAASPFFFN